MAHRRGRRALVKTGTISLTDVRARDGDSCYICGRRTTNNTTATRRSGTARVLEHVVPIVLGGEDTMFNVRIACHECDSKKGGGAEMVNIFALLQAVSPQNPKKKKETHIPVKKPVVKKEPDGWWNYEDKPDVNAISVAKITSRQELHDWWNRDKGSAT